MGMARSTFGVAHRSFLASEAVLGSFLTLL